MAQKPFKAQTSVITCDMQGIVQEYAADAGELFGWSPAEVIGKLSVATFHLPENVPTLVPRLLKEAVENGKFEEEVTLRRKDGDVFRAVLTVRPVFRGGKQVGYMGMTHPLEPPRPPSETVRGANLRWPDRPSSRGPRPSPAPPREACRRTRSMR